VTGQWDELRPLMKMSEIAQRCTNLPAQNYIFEAESLLQHRQQNLVIDGVEGTAEDQ